MALIFQTMAKVSASLNQREQEKVAVLDQLKAANDALQAEIGKHRTVSSRASVWFTPRVSLSHPGCHSHTCGVTFTQVHNQLGP